MNYTNPQILSNPLINNLSALRNEAALFLRHRALIATQATFANRDRIFNSIDADIAYNKACIIYAERKALGFLACVAVTQ